MTFIILEGVDGGGKSTLADKLKTYIEETQETEPEYRHCGQLDQDPIDEYALDIESYEPDSFRHIISDRWHIGETIYGPIYRGKSALSPAAFRWVELFLAARGAVVFNITASLETVVDRLNTRGEEFLLPGDVERVRDAFIAYGVKEQNVVYGGEIVTDDGEDINALVEKMYQIAEFSEMASATYFTPSYIGPSIPHALLVGSSPFNEDNATQAPFVPRDGNDGEFLIGSLPDIWWTTTGIFNIADPNVSVLTLWEDLLNPPVVALGEEASEILTSMEISHAVVPAPSTVLALDSSKQIEYGNLVRSASIDQKDYSTWPN